jgi:hypothetical protein
LRGADRDVGVESQQCTKVYHNNAPNYTQQPKICTV